MVGNVTIQGQIVGTATFDGAKISAVVTIAPPINATVVFGKSGVSVHNELTGRDAVDAHPIEAITGLTEVLETIPSSLGFTPEDVANKKTTLTNSATDYPSTSAVNRLTELKQTDSPEFAGTQITTLDSVANGGIIPNSEATWLGATAKSVLSYFQKLVSKVYAINSRVAVLEDDLIYEVLTTATAASVTISLDKNGNAFSLSECILSIIYPSSASTLIYIQINGITSAVYNSNTSTYYNQTRFVIPGGSLQGIVLAKLFYDNDIKTVTIQSDFARMNTSTSFAGGSSIGFMNLASISNRISSITITQAGNVVFPIGTKFILRKK